MTATSLRVIARLGCGRRAVLPSYPGASGPNTTFMDRLAASPRVASVTARLNGPSGSGLFFAPFAISPALAQRDVCGRGGQFFAEAALIEFGDYAAFQLVAFVEEA